MVDSEETKDVQVEINQLESAESIEYNSVAINSSTGESNEDRLEASSVKPEEENNITPKKIVSARVSPRRTPDIERIARFFKNNTPTRVNNSDRMKCNNMDAFSKLQHLEEHSSNGSESLKNRKLVASPSNSIPFNSEEPLMGSLRNNMLNKLNYSSEEDTPPSQRKSVNNLVKNDLNPLNIVSKLKQAQKNLSNLKVPLSGITDNGIELDYSRDEGSEVALIDNTKIEDVITGSPIKHSPSNNNVSSEEQVKMPLNNLRILSTNNPNVSDYSIIDDTTDANITFRWIDKSENDNIMAINIPTQVITTMNTENLTLSPTQIIDSTFHNIKQTNSQVLSAREDNISELGNNKTNDGLQHNDITSNINDMLYTQQLDTQKVSISQLSNLIEGNVETNSSNKLAPEHINDIFPDDSKEDAKTPHTSKNIFSQAALEVPQTNSQSKTECFPSLKMTDSSPTPKNKQETWEQVNLSKSNSPGKVFLRMSNKIGPQSSQSYDNSSYIDTDNNIVVVSEAEMTQELPEMDENTQEYFLTKENDTQILDTPKLSGSTKAEGSKRQYPINIKTPTHEQIKYENPHKRSKRLPDSAPKSATDKDGKFTDEEDQATKSVDRSESETFPKSVLTKEDHVLTQDDIRFKNSVFCFYDLNYKIYPGTLISHDYLNYKSMVRFETDQSIIKNTDIFYLDIKIGDTINWNGSLYKVMKLECKFWDANTIRCIRGYDTLHLRKKTQSGGLSKKTVITSLGSITLNFDDWAKRAKIDYYQKEVISKHGTPARNRNTLMLSSPLYRKATPEMNPNPKFAKREPTTSVLEKYSNKISHERNINTSTNLFSNCLFIITSIFNERDEIIDIIKSQGGTVVIDGFSSLFDYYLIDNKNESVVSDYNLNLKWKDESAFKGFKFACLLSSEHSRSLKYLETLVLKWPALHWQFIVDCLISNTLLINEIYNYLLPAGFSSRLKSESNSLHGVMKSSDIFFFYKKILENTSLVDILPTEPTELGKYDIVIIGNSNINNFLIFSFACMGVKKLFMVNNAEKIEDLLSNFSSRLNEDEEFNPNLVFYADGENDIESKVILQSIKDNILNYSQFEDKNIHIESKEWLIQTIINGSPNFYVN